MVSRFRAVVTNPIPLFFHYFECRERNPLRCTLVVVPVLRASRIYNLYDRHCPRRYARRARRAILPTQGVCDAEYYSSEAQRDLTPTHRLPKELALRRPNELTERDIWLSHALVALLSAILAIQLELTKDC